MINPSACSGPANLNGKTVVQHVVPMLSLHETPKYRHNTVDWFQYKYMLFSFIQKWLLRSHQIYCKKIGNVKNTLKCMGLYQGTKYNNARTMAIPPWSALCNFLKSKVAFAHDNHLVGMLHGTCHYDCSTLRKISEGIVNFERRNG